MPVAPEHAGGGPVYFAWVDASETTFGAEHIRYDDYILKFDIVQEEGKLPTATLDIKNPGALLAAGRKQWAWIAFDDGSDVVPKFFGRIVAVPSSIFDPVITINFIGKPLDYLARKLALAATLKADPDYYDPIFIDPKYWDDPDTILEARSAAWHHDPVSHEVTISDYLVGEAGVAEFLATEVVRGSVRYSIGEAPKASVKMDAGVVWTQSAAGGITLPPLIVSSFTGQGLLGDWPKAGSQLDGGWSVQSSSAVDKYKADAAYIKPTNYSWKNANKDHSNGDAMSVNMSQNYPVLFGPAVEINKSVTESFTIGDPETGRAASMSIQSSSTFIAQSLIVLNMTLGYGAKRDRSEHIRFTLTADLQPILTDAGGTDDIEILTLSGADVGTVVGSDINIAIGDAARRSFFPTDRGQQAVIYVLNVARAHLVQGLRVVSVSFDFPFHFGLSLSCRHNALLHDPAVPSGSALGKITKLTLSGEGRSGRFVGNLEMGCATGLGAAVEAVGGDPTYVDADVLGPETQVFDNRVVVLGTGDLGFSRPVDAADDDGVSFPLSRDQAVVRYQVVTGTVSQADAVTAASSPRAFPTNAIRSTPELLDGAQQQAVITNDVFKDAGIWVELELKPLTNGPFEAAYDLSVTHLSVPAQVDLTGA